MKSKRKFKDGWNSEGKEGRGRQKNKSVPFSGFTLMEVMIAMAILSIALVTAFQSQSQSISMASNSRFLTTASLLAQSKMAEVDAVDPKEIIAGSGDFGKEYAEYEWRVEVMDSEMEYLKKITVVVKNNNMRANNTYQLVLYKISAK